MLKRQKYADNLLFLHNKIAIPIDICSDIANIASQYWKASVSFIKVLWTVFPDNSAKCAIGYALVIIIDYYYGTTSILIITVPVVTNLAKIPVYTYISYMYISQSHISLETILFPYTYPCTYPYSMFAPSWRYTHGNSCDLRAFENIYFLAW